MNDIIGKAKQYVTEYLNNNLNKDYNFHSINHTFNVVNNAGEIGRESFISDKELEIVILAAWFHDVGYTKTCNGHENVSIKIAEEFLIANHYPNEDIKQVKKCIKATKLSHKPASLLEEILSDSDILHIGKVDYLEKAELLRQELKKNQDKNYTDNEWIRKNIKFISEHIFYTDYANKNYDYQRIENIEKLKNQLKNSIVKD